MRKNVIARKVNAALVEMRPIEPVRLYFRIRSQIPTGHMTSPFIRIPGRIMKPMMLRYWFSCDLFEVKWNSQNVSMRTRPTPTNRSPPSVIGFVHIGGRLAGAAGVVGVVAGTGSGWVVGVVMAHVL